MALFGRSRVRDRILVEFFSKRGTAAHVREVARRIGASPPAVGVELAELARLGILGSEPVGRSLVYSVNERSPLVPEVRGLVQKTLGIQALLANALNGLAGVESAYIFGSYASATDRPQSDIDLLVIGRPDRVALSERLAPVERATGRDVNVVTRTEAELQTRHRGSNHFWQQVLGKPMVHVAGRELRF